MVKFSQNNDCHTYQIKFNLVYTGIIIKFFICEYSNLELINIYNYGSLYQPYYNTKVNFYN